MVIGHMKPYNGPAVYRIVHLSGATYVGSTHYRWRRLVMHLWQLRSGRHGNRNLQKLWDQSHEHEWLIEFARSSSKGDELLEEEQFLIDEVSPEFRININPLAGLTRYGAKLSPETRALLSAAKLGRKMSPAAVRKNREAQRLRRELEKKAGIRRLQSAASIEKIRAKAIGRGHTEETRKKIGDIVRGIKRRPETRAKMSAARAAYWKRKKEQKHGQKPTGFVD